MEKFGAGCFSAAILMWIASAYWWLVHVIWILTKLSSDAGATAGQIVIGIIGALLSPIGVIHGIMISMGFIA